MRFFFLPPAIFFFRLDIDECTTNVHNCDSLAVCNNTVGSFYCTCIAGYEGNGTACIGERCFYVLFGNALLGLRTRFFMS